MSAIVETLISASKVKVLDKEKIGSVDLRIFHTRTAAGRETASCGSNP